MMAMVKDRESTTKRILEESTTIGRGGRRHDDFPSNECNINPKPQFYTANRVLVVSCWYVIGKNLPTFMMTNIFLWNVIITKIAKWLVIQS